MTAAIDIANRALGDVGADPIDSFDDDSKQARLCKKLFPQLRDAMLRSHPWNFGKVRASLPALAAAPAWGYRRAFQLPSDYLRLLHVRDDVGAWWTPFECHGLNFEVEGTTIVTDALAPLHVLYIATQPDTAVFDALFTDALVSSLASNLCMPMTKDSSLAQSLQQTAAARLSIARGVSNIENGDHTRLPTRILAVRR